MQRLRRNVSAKAQLLSLGLGALLLIDGLQVFAEEHSHVGPDWLTSCIDSEMHPDRSSDEIVTSCISQFIFECHIGTGEDSMLTLLAESNLCLLHLAEILSIETDRRALSIEGSEVNDRIAADYADAVCSQLTSQSEVAQCVLTVELARLIEVVR